MGVKAAVTQTRTQRAAIGLPGGTALVLTAEALAFPAGLIATILLTRHLTSSDYGALALALAGTAWLEWTVVSLFSRVGWKLIAEADDWRAVARAVVRLFLLASLPVGVLVFAAADVIAAVLEAPRLSVVLRVVAFDIPLFATAQAYRAVLIGRGRHGARATSAAVRWTARAMLIAVGVLLGLSLPALAALYVAATALELVVAQQLAVGSRAEADHTTAAAPARAKQLTVGRLIAYSAPVAVSAICMRLFERVDIFALRLLDGSLASVGAYGVAQNLALAPTLFGSALTPALIAALSLRLARGDDAGARSLSNDALRAAFLILPLALLAAGAAPALIDLLFGDRYAAAAPPFALLIVGAVGTLVLTLTSGVLVAAGHLRWTIVLTAPLILVAVAGHLVFIPRWGVVGAAAVTCATALLGALSGCAALHYIARVRMPWPTLVRGCALGTAAGWLASRLPAEGVAFVVMLGGIAIALALAILLTGELRPDERAQLSRRARALRQPAPAQRP